MPRMFSVDLEICQVIALENRILKCLLIILFPLGKKETNNKLRQVP